jgi:hypothetical protein
VLQGVQFVQLLGGSGRVCRQAQGVAHAVDGSFMVLCSGGHLVLEVSSLPYNFCQPGVLVHSCLSQCSRLLPGCFQLQFSVQQLKVLVLSLRRLHGHQ